MGAKASSLSMAVVSDQTRPNDPERLVFLPAVTSLPLPPHPQPGYFMNYEH